MAHVMLFGFAVCVYAIAIPTQNVCRVRALAGRANIAGVFRPVYACVVLLPVTPMFTFLCHECSFSHGALWHNARAFVRFVRALGAHAACSTSRRWLHVCTYKYICYGSRTAIVAEHTNAVLNWSGRMHTRRSRRAINSIKLVLFIAEERQVRLAMASPRSPLRGQRSVGVCVCQSVRQRRQEGEEERAA